MNCGASVNLGRYGKTYEIVERDALTEIEEKAKKLDWEKLVSPVREKVKNFKPSNLPPSFPDSDKERTFTVDMTYTLTFDITDVRGNVLYPKGYTFNPLNYVKYPKTLVFIDGGKKSHVSWFKKSELYKDMAVTLLITDGSYYELMRELKRPVFYATKVITDRFQIRKLPSVVKQKGGVMEVKEIPVRKVNRQQ